MKKTTQYAVMASIVAALALTTTAHASRNQDVERQVRSYFKDIPVMVRIAKCESGFRHYDPRHPNRQRPTRLRETSVQAEWYA